MMHSNTICENVQKFEIACNGNGGAVACSSPNEKNGTKVHIATNRKLPETKHGEESCKNEACLSSSPQRQNQMYNLASVKIEKTEPFLYEEKNNSGSSKSKNDGRSPSNDLYRISLYNVIKVEPQTEVQRVVDQTLVKSVNGQVKDCSVGNSASQYKNGRKKRKCGRKQKNKRVKRTKQTASTAKNEQPGNLVTDESNRTGVPCAGNAASEQEVDHVTDETDGIEVPCSENGADEQQGDHVTSETNGIKVCAEKAACEVASSQTVCIPTSVGQKNERVLTKMPVSGSSHMECKSVAIDKPKSVTVDSQTYQCQMKPTVDIHAGEQQCAISSSEISMPSTNTQEAKANSSRNRLFEYEKEKKVFKKYAPLGHRSCDQRVGRQMSSRSGHGHWQREDRQGYPHEYPWQQTSPREFWHIEGNRQSRESEWQNQSSRWQDRGNQMRKNGYVLENPGSTWYIQGNRALHERSGWHSQGNGWHNQENLWHYQGNGWHKEENGWHHQGSGFQSQENYFHNQGNDYQADGWHSQRNDWHKQRNAWHNQGSAWCNQGNSWHNQQYEMHCRGLELNKSDTRQNMRNGWHNMGHNMQKQLQNRQKRDSRWQTQAYDRQNQYRKWHNQSSNSQNHTWRIQSSGFTQRDISKMSDNKIYETEGNVSSGKENMSSERQVKEDEPSINKIQLECSMFTVHAADVDCSDTENRGDPQDEHFECKVVEEIIRKESPENVEVGKTQHSSEKWSKTNEGNRGDVQLYQEQDLDCSGSDTEELEQDVIYLTSEGSLKPEETMGIRKSNSSLKSGDECVKKNISLENSEDDRCFANNSDKCAGGSADDECMVLNTIKHSEADSGIEALDETDNLNISIGSSKDSNLEEIEIMWENVNTSNPSDIPLIDIT